MNLFHFLKSKKGAIKPLNSILVSGAAATAFFVVTNHAANQQIEAERQTRTLTSISGTSPQEGMHRRGGMLTSINVRDGLDQLATAEERAQMETNNALTRYQANQRALGELGTNIGRAAQFSDADDGLNTRNRETLDDATRLVVGNPNAVNGQFISQGAGSREGRNASGSSQGTLTPASITRASGGSSLNNSFVPGSGNTSGTTGGIATEGPRRLSGSMPGGTNIVSRMGLDGATARANSSSFGRDRNGRGRGTRSVGNERNELKDILKKSATANENANSSANEGGKAFLANSQMSGGVTLDGSSDSGNTATSQDLAVRTANKLKSVGNHLDSELEKQEERDAKHQSLIRQLLGTVALSVLLMIVGAAILRKLDDIVESWEFEASVATLPADKAACLAMAKMFKLKRWLVAAGLIASVGALNAWLYITAKQFVSDYGAYGGTTIATIAQIVSVLSVAAAVQTAVQPRWKDFIKNFWKNAKAMFNPAGLFMPKI